MSTPSTAQGKPRDWIPEETRAHLHAAHHEMHASLQALLPPAFLEHRRAARHAALLAVRSWIDHVLAETSQTPRT
jgi:hypothetical protein